MKKSLLFFCAAVLMLAGCGARSMAPESTPAVAPSVSQSSEVSEVEPLEPVESVDEVLEPVEDADSADKPARDKLEALIVGDGFDENPESLTLDAALREQLWPLLRTAEWVKATDLPETGMASEFYLLEGEQAWFFNRFEDKVLIVPSMPDENGEKVCWFAPLDIVKDVVLFSRQ